MAHITSTVASFRIDDSTAAIATISGSVINASVSGDTTHLDDTGLGDGQHTMLYGLKAAPTVTANGFLNSTTEAIFAPLTDGTSVAKTVGVGFVSGQFLNGEVLVGAVQLTQAVDAIGTWSFAGTFQSGLTRTSVAAT